MAKAEFPDVIHLGRLARRPTKRHPHLVGAGNVCRKAHRAAVWLNESGARVVLDRDGTHRKGGQQVELDAAKEGDDCLRASGRTRISGHAYDIDLVAIISESGEDGDRRWELRYHRIDSAE